MLARVSAPEPHNWSRKALIDRELVKAAVQEALCAAASNDRAAETEVLAQAVLGFHGDLSRALHLAARCGGAGAVRALLHVKASVDNPGELVGAAAAEGQPDVLPQLLRHAQEQAAQEQAAEINIPASDILRAAECNDPRALRVLVQAKVNVDSTFPNERTYWWKYATTNLTPLAMALARGGGIRTMRTIVRLVRAKADPNNENMLKGAICERGRVRTVRVLLSAKAILPPLLLDSVLRTTVSAIATVRDQGGDYAGREEHIRWLVRLKANPHGERLSDSVTAMQCAVRTGDRCTMALLRSLMTDSEA